MQFKVGDYVWWTAERYCKSWSVPGLVVELSDTKIKIKTFDDNKITELSLESEILKDEFRESSLAETQSFIMKKITTVKKNILDLEQSIHECESKIIAFNLEIEKLK